ncbi:uncharacterized protein METZ01_LOCUS338035 [marine metagenome]|uniref:Uncharacterized protein n=1 Tax=marine metagenome TaxID=408172 RepID=A0A382QLH5_9ZZZZ
MDRSHSASDALFCLEGHSLWPSSTQNWAPTWSSRTQAILLILFFESGGPKDEMYALFKFEGTSSAEMRLSKSSLLVFSSTPLRVLYLYQPSSDLLPPSSIGRT